VTGNSWPSRSTLVFRWPSRLVLIQPKIPYRTTRCFRRHYAKMAERYDRGAKPPEGEAKSGDGEAKPAEGEKVH
jgi:hypothetical protein